MHGLDVLVKLAVNSQDLSTPRTIKPHLIRVEQKGKLSFSQSGKFSQLGFPNFSDKESEHCQDATGHLAPGSIEKVQIMSTGGPVFRSFF